MNTGGRKRLKLFGGSGGHNNKPSGRASQSRAGYASQSRTAKPKAAPAAPQRVNAAKTAPKPAGKKGGKVKKTLTKAQKRRRIIISVVVVLALIVGVAAAAVMFIRPPQHTNNPTIKDKENGDKINVDSLLNSGTRIDDVFTFVIGAVDEDETRTDALMVATMDTKQKTINVMNIPRDTMCNNNASGASRKINAAYAMGGIDQTKREIERLMGFQPDKYVIVNFDGIAAIVDAIGGVDYEIPFRMQYDDPSQDLHIDLYAGMQHLTGEQVVHFLRWRHNNDYSMQYPNGDEGRVATQQDFLKELARQVLQISNITKIPAIADAVFKNVKTDLTAGELLWMGMQALQINNGSIRFFTLPGYGAMSTAGTSTAFSFFFPYYQETLDLVNQYFNPYEEEITTLDMVGGPESYSGGGDYTSSDPEENYVWGDTSEDDTESDTGTDTPSGGWTDPETDGGTGGSGTGGGETGGGTTDPGTGGGETGGTTDPGTGGGETGGGTTDPGTGGGETGGGTTDPGTGGGETGGGTTDPGTGGGETGGGDVPVDPEA